jgi:shikimate dehydrogenase
LGEYKLRVFQTEAMPINAATRVCAVFGSPIRHSASPAMHNAAFAALGLNWRYLAFEVRPENLRQALLGARDMGFAGVNLTVPHKLLALECVDVLDESARLWGAVNTVRFEGRQPDGQWLPLCQFEQTLPGEIRSHGFNTDAAGLEHALQEDLQLTLTKKKILLLGAGGAGRMAALKCARAGAAELYLVNRTAARALEIATEIGRQFPAVRVSAGYPQCDVDLLLNATSLGLGKDDSSPLDETQFAPERARAVYDMIYRPAETRLLARAKAARCQTANGLGMLVGQGALAFQLWTGLAAPVTVMRCAAELNIYGH